MSFEERLLDELKRDAVLRDVARVPVRRRVVRRGLLAGAVCAAVAVGWAVLPTSSESAAYAVEKNSDGSVTLSVKEAGGEEVALRLVSVPEEIRRGGMAVDVASGTCADDPGDPMPEWVENTTGPDKAVRKYLAWKVTLKSEGVAPYVVWVREDDGKFVPCVPDKS